MKNNIQKVYYEEFKNEHYIYRLRQLCLIYTYLEPIIGDRTDEIFEIQKIIEELQIENAKNIK